MDNCSKSMFITLTIIATLLAAFTTNCHANDSKKRARHSKDYREFPAGSPEAVLTAFIETDLGDIFNRQDDDRYPLWWRLTESCGAPEDYQKLIIDSYQITRQVVNSPPDEVILNLAVDVKSIGIDGNPQDKNTGWRNLIVYIEDVQHSLASTKSLLEYLYGSENSIVNKILRSEGGYYKIPINKHLWNFPVTMILSNNKWLISTKTIPIQMAYTISHVNYYKKLIADRKIFDDICIGKQKLQSSILRQYSYSDYETIGVNYRKYKQKYCTDEEKAFRQKLINDYSNTIKILVNEE